MSSILYGPCCVLPQTRPLTSASSGFLDGPRLVHPFLLKRHVRSNKADPLVDEVELLQANPHYAFVRYPDGRETTVSTKHLAPTPTSTPQDQILPRDSVLESTVGNSPSSPLPAHVQQEVPTATEQTNITVNSGQPTLRRSGRIRHPVDRLNL